jgi:hypothetical protein
MLLGGSTKAWPIDWPWIWASTWILRSSPGQLLFHPLRLNSEGRSIGLFIVHDKLSASYTGRVCTLLVCCTTNHLFFLFFFGIILTFVCHIGLPGCRQQTIPLMCLRCLFTFSKWQWTIKGCFSKRRGTVA